MSATCGLERKNLYGYKTRFKTENVYAQGSVCNLWHCQGCTANSSSSARERRMANPIPLPLVWSLAQWPCARLCPASNFRSPGRVVIQPQRSWERSYASLPLLDDEFIFLFHASTAVGWFQSSTCPVLNNIRLSAILLLEHLTRRSWPRVGASCLGPRLPARCSTHTPRCIHGL